MYTIFTDSCADLRPDYVAQQKDFGVMALTYTIGNETYADAPGKGLDALTFYKRLSQGESSVTSQINATTICEAFRPLLQEGKDVLYIAFSSALSGTYQSAVVAKGMLEEEKLPGKLAVVDSLAASAGQGLFVSMALDKRAEGMSFEDLTQWLLDNRQHIAHWFTVDDLNFLKRGGRCSPAAAFFGTMMSIKPVLHVDAEGRLIARDKLRGRHAAFRGLVKRMESLAVDPKEYKVFLSNAACLQEAEQVCKMIHESLGVPMDRFVISDIGPVIGSHAGPGTIALFFWAKDRG